MPIPPGGYSGFAQMTPASRLALSPVLRANGGNGTRRRRKKGKKARRASGTKRASSSGRKMKFGSPAWQKKYKVGKFRK